jgi:restriction endonuclease S subunit
MYSSFVNSEDLIDILAPGSYSPEILEATHATRGCPLLGPMLAGDPRLGITGTIQNAYVSEDYPGAVPYITTKQIDGPTVYPVDCKFIHKEADKVWAKCRVLDGDILICKSGKVGSAGLLRTLGYSHCNSVSDVINIRLSQSCRIDPYYLVLFLNSRWGQSQLQQQSGGAVFDHVSIYAIPELRIKSHDPETLCAIGNKVRKAERLRELAEDAHRSFQNWLRSAAEEEVFGNENLAFLSHIPSKTCSDSAWIQDFDLADRMDPWPFHLAPRTIRRHLNGLEGTISFSNALEIVTEARARINPPLAPNCYHLSVLDVDAAGRIDWRNAEIARYDGMGVTIRNGDIVYSTLNPQETRVGYIVAEQGATIAASPEFSILRLKEEFADYPYLVSAALRSNWIRIQASFLTRSSSLSHRRLAEQDLGRILIPWKDEHLQELEQKLALASDAYVQAEALVQQAKADVEALISNTLDLDALHDESTKIEAWLAANPSPATRSN